MKKALAISISFIALLVLSILAIGYALSQSQYITPITNHLLAQFANTPVSIHAASYTFPNQLKLEGVQLESPAIAIDQVELWVSSSSITEQALVLDNLHLNGLNLPNGIPDTSLPFEATLNNLTISNLDYSDEHIVARDVDLQINSPQVSLTPELNLLGNIQLSAAQLYWQGEAFDNLLIDADLKAKESTLYGISFGWRGGRFSGQAEQYPQGWSLINTTIDNLHLTQTIWRDISLLNWGFLTEHIYHINSLDLLNATLELPDFQLIKGNLSIEELLLPAKDVKQKRAHISLGAESIGYLDKRWLNPSLDMYISDDTLTVADFNFSVEQGDVYLQGDFSSTSAHLSQLNVIGLKWFHELDNPSTKLFTSLKQYFNALDSLTIDALKVEHAQLVQLAKQPHWQASGIYIEGQQLELKRQGAAGLWQGNLRMSANNASLSSLVASQPLVKMHSRDGYWQLDELFIPLENGLIEASANYHFTQASQPWHLTMSADGLPLGLMSEAVELPIAFEGLAEFQVNAHGLGGDLAMLQHSFTGEFTGNLRDAVLIDQDGRRATQVSEISVLADRGRIRIEPIQLTGAGFKGELLGHYDLLEQEQASVALEIEELTQSDSPLLNECQLTSFNLLLNSSTTSTKPCTD